MRSLIFVIALVLPFLAGCASSKPEAGRSGAVTVSLYAYRVDEMFEPLLRLRTAKDLEKIRTWQKYLSVELDLSKGLPVASFSPQVKRHAEVVKTLQKTGTTHVWDDRYLSYLPACFFNRVGWIEWYLVRRDSSGRVIGVYSHLGPPIFGKSNLIKHAKPGDEIIGLWGC